MGTAAAVIVAREKHIVAAFREAHATSPAAAVTPGALGVEERLAFRRLRQRAILRESESGLVYLDEPAWEALRATRRRLALVLTVAVIVMALILLARR
jgi:hypothetical protein